MPDPVYTIESGDLGDNLFVTPVFRHHRNGIIRMVDCPESRNVAAVYDGIASPLFTPHPTHNQVKWWRHDEHKAVQILKAVGRAGDDPLPYVVLTEQELATARGLVGVFKNPVLISFNVKVGDTKTAEYRSPGFGLAQVIVNTLVHEGYYPVCIARGQVPPKQVLNNVLYIESIDLRTFLACAKVIGRYCGVDSGSLHAMVGVGGQVIGTIPAHHPEHFPHGPYLWKGEKIWMGRKPRAQYVEFAEIGRLPRVIKSHFAPSSS